VYPPPARARVYGAPAVLLRSVRVLDDVPVIPQELNVLVVPDVNSKVSVVEEVFVIPLNVLEPANVITSEEMLAAL
jgi:hypothetical protein